ncbi:FRG domain-containing protein [Ochrobactrum sp. S46]|nr:FRG domain-containing protein [Ochrobactrum sp. S45]MBK0044087.1 FRG domain-containing protein [Ochrobactrum sp. S46]
MFNLLMSSNEFEWADHNEGSNIGKFELSRFLEYTKQDIVSNFLPIDDEKIKKLAEIPTLFISEIQYQSKPEHITYVSVGIGYISNPRIVDKEILYNYNIVGYNPKFIIDDKVKFSLAFGMSNFELHRTHWAIKDIKLSEALYSMGIIFEQMAQIKPFNPDEILNQPAPEPETISTLEDFINKVLKLKPETGEEFFYRGQSDRTYSLVPSIFREHESGGYMWADNEDILVREILTAQAKEFGGDQTMIDRLVRMQHYRLPTRLLDISSNPLIALYFSCSEKPDAVGEFFILKSRTTDIKYYDSDSVSCIANLCLLTGQEKSRIQSNMSPEDFRGKEEAKRLHHFICREKPYFQERIAPSDLSRIIFVRGRILHERISSQSGAFLLFGQNAVLPKTGRSDLDIKSFLISNKSQILDDLSRLNIKSSTVYPSMEETAKEIARVHLTPPLPQN